MRVAVKTASDMYLWTAKQIYKNPFIVYDIQIKPTWDRVILKGIKNCFSVYLSFNSGITSREFTEFSSSNNNS